MAKDSEPTGKKEVVEPQFLQIYESLPSPQNNKQFTELLTWLDKDRDRVFTHAKFIEICKRVFILLFIGVLLYFADARLESFKWLLKLLSPFLK